MKRIVTWALIVVLGIVAVLAGIVWLAPGEVLDAGLWLRRRNAGLTVHHVTAAQHDIAYLEGGTGEPLVLLHGFGADKDNWDLLARYLTPHFHVIALDLPGSGDSTRDPNAKYGFQDQADRLDAILAAIGITGPFHIGGNSMGGGIAGLYATQHPDRVKTLWLVDNAGVLGAKPSKLRLMIAAGHNPMVMRNAQEFDDLLALAFVHPPAVPGFLKPVIVERAAARHDFNEKVFADLTTATFSLEGPLKGFPGRTLITWGSQDQLIDVSAAEILHGLMRNSTLDIIPDVGHVPMMEQPKLVAEHYLNFQAPAK